MKKNITDLDYIEFRCLEKKMDCNVIKFNLGGMNETSIVNMES